MIRLFDGFGAVWYLTFFQACLVLFRCLLISFLGSCCIVLMILTCLMVFVLFGWFLSV